MTKLNTKTDQKSKKKLDKVIKDIAVEAEENYRKV